MTDGLFVDLDGTFVDSIFLHTVSRAPDEGQAPGCSTSGSSEACMLGGPALKRRWQHALQAAGLSAERPNIVMGINAQVCWQKFANYWDVEARLVPMEGDRFHLSGPATVERCDENTIGVVAILGSTFDGSYEPVAEICAALDELHGRTGWDIPVHVDAASGGMIAPSHRSRMTTSGRPSPAAPRHPSRSDAVGLTLRRRSERIPSACRDRVLQCQRGRRRGCRCSRTPDVR